MSKKDVLSEGELDALMEEISDSDASPGDPAFSKECEAFDFNARDQNLLAQIPAVGNLNEKLALEYAQVVRKLYGITVQVDVESSRMVPLEELFAEVTAPTAVNMVRIAPLSGLCYVIFPGELLSRVVDKYFGGGVAESAEAPSRANLTHSERRVNDALLEGFLTTLAETWREKIKLAATVQSFESNPDFLQVPVPGEQVLCFPFNVRLGEWAAHLTWVVPYAALEPLRAKLGSAGLPEQPSDKNTDWEQHFQRELSGVELELSGAFVSEQVSIADVLGFKTGSIVPLRMPTEVVVSIEGQPFSVGEHGVLNGHKSVKIKEMIRGNQ